MADLQTSPDLLAKLCKVNLSNTKNLASCFFILASFLVKGMYVTYS